MTDEARFAKLQADLHARIQESITQFDDAAHYLMRFVVLAETIDQDGERSMHQVAADGMKRWETLGMLDQARAVEYASTVAELGDTT